MRSVARSAAPDFFAALRAAYSRWDELDGAERNRIRSALVRDFGVVCAYCQCPCAARPESDDDPNAETVDHFRPRHLFPAQWLDWLNLVYCGRLTTILSLTLLPAKCARQSNLTGRNGLWPAAQLPTWI